MTAAFELLIFIGFFGLGIGLLGKFMAGSDEKKRRLVVTHESRHLSRQPWDARSSRDRGNR